jgi:hypothetical protein
MKRAIFLLLFSLWVLWQGFDLYTVHAGGPLSLPANTQGLFPKVDFADWKGDKLFVYGKQFADGAFVVINGIERRTIRVDSPPPMFPSGQTLMVKKARKKLPAEDLITIKVINPDGVSSEDFIFYSGMTIGFSTNPERQLHLKVGERFLVFYPNDSDAFNALWHISFYNNFPAAIQPDPTMPFVPRSLGFYQAVGPGNVALHMDLDTCPGLPCGSYAQIIGASIFVE